MPEVNTIENFILDPFGVDNLATPQHIIEENTNTVSVNSIKENKPTRTRSKVARKKFFISKDLKKRLLHLTKTSTNENALKLANALLNLKYETESRYNYLGLSESDFTKISYLDDVRTEKFTNQFQEYHSLTVGDKLVHANKRYVRDTEYNWVYQTAYQQRDIRRNQLKKQIKLIHVNDLKMIIDAIDLESINEEVSEEISKKINENSFFTLIKNKLTRDCLLPEHVKKKLDGVNHSVTTFENEIEYNDVKYINLSKFVAFIPENTYDYYLSRNSRPTNIIFDSRNACIRTVNNIVSDNITGEFYFMQYSDYTASYVKEEKVRENRVWDSAIRYHTKIGKLIRKIFPNMYNDVEISDFSEEYQKLIVIDKPNTVYNEVSGEMIKHYYLDDNAQNNGTLGNSCMRYAKCQIYFKIYTENPRCKLAVLLHNGKVACRALLWTIDNVTYYDRIYYSNNDNQFLMQNTLAAKGYVSIYGSGHALSMEIDMKTFDSYGQYPYMDTFRYYIPDKAILTNIEPYDEEYYRLSSTSGTYEIQSNHRLVCDHCDGDTDEEDSVMATVGRYRGERLCSDCYAWTTDDDTCLDSETIITYDDCRYYINYTVSLHDGQYAYEHDDELATYQDTGELFILSIHSYQEHDGEYYSMSYVIPEEAEESDVLEEN